MEEQTHIWTSKEFQKEQMKEAFRRIDELRKQLKTTNRWLAVVGFVIVVLVVIIVFHIFQ